MLPTMYTPTQQHELDQTGQDYTVSSLKNLDHQGGIDDLSTICPVFDMYAYSVES